MSEWKKVFETNISLYCRIIIQYLIESGWKSISIDEYTKKMPDFPVKNAVQSKLYKKEGLFPIVSQSKDLISGFSDDEQLLNKISKPIIIFGDHTQVVKYIDFDFVLGADGTKILTVTNDYNPKFIYYLIKSIDLHSNKYARHYSKLRKEKIPFQENSLAIQHKIASFLDSLENNNISNESYFDKETEKKILSLQKNSLNIQRIEKEIESQKNYIKQLRQNILQQAIEGKLTADWRKKNPVQKGNPDYDAEALFEQIQKGEVSPSLQPASQFSATPSAGSNATRNARSKSLAPITDEEKQFEIPEGWKWVRLDFLSTNILYGVSESAKENGKYKLLRITDIQNNFVDWDTVPYTDFNEAKVNQYLLHHDDILFARTGGTVGKSYLVEDCPSNTIYASYLIRVRLTKSINSHFIKSFFESPFYWKQITDNLVGTGQPNCNGQKLSNLVLPLPPLKEQDEIVNKVETLLAKATTLENQIQDRKLLSDKLFFGIIKEAFMEN